MGYIAKGSITLDTVNDAYTVAMTVPSCMIHADFDGSNPQLDNACTYITVLRGDKIMPFNCTSLLSGNEQIGISLTNTNRTTYLLKITSIPNNTLQGSVPLSITTDDGYITQVSFSYTVVRESTMLDWIQDWEGGKTKIGSTYIMTPKLFIGKKDQFAQYGPTGSNPKNDIMSVPGLTGVYIGPDQSSTGIYGYKNSVEIFHLNSQGGMIGGWDINNGGIQSKDGFLRILSDGHITATNSSGATIWELDSSGNAKFANGNITFNSDGSAKYKGRIESSEGKIGGWEINNLALYSTQVGVNSVNKYLAIANIQSIPTNNGTWDGNHLSWVRAYGGVAMYYTSNSDFGFIAYKGTSKTFSAGASNYIAGWNFDGDAMWIGTKNNALGALTASSGSITIGTNGIRGYKWRIDASGKAAFVGGNVVFNENDGSIFGWSLSSYRISTAHAALVSHSSYGGLFLSAQDISGVSVTSLASTIQNSGGIFMYANSSKSTLVSYNSDGTSTFCLSSNGSNYIAGWNFDKECLYLGTKANTSGAYASKFGITIGSNGIRSYKCRFETDGSGAIAGGKISWNSEGIITFASDVSLNWSNISGAIGNKLTKIDSNGVYTGTVSANNITAGTIIGSTIKQAATSPKWSLNSDGSGSLAGGKISWTSAGVLNAQNANFNNVMVNGSITTPFRDGYYVLSSGGGITVSTLGLQNNNNVVIPGASGNWNKAVVIPFTAEYNGFRAIIMNDDWGGQTAGGPWSYTISDDKNYYFFENGAKKKTLTINKHEGVEMIGYGEGNTFKGWIILNRIDKSGDRGYPFYVCFAGIVKDGTLTKIKKYHDEDITVSKLGTGIYRVSFGLSWSSVDNYMVFLTGQADQAGRYASLYRKSTTYFDVYTGDDSSANDGDFQFMVVNISAIYMTLNA